MPMSRTQRSIVGPMRYELPLRLFPDDDALQIRDHYELCLLNGPGSALQHSVPQRVRDMGY
jgi:hypothetical protein